MRFISFYNLNNEDSNPEKRVLRTLRVMAIIFFVGIFFGAGLGRGIKLKKKIHYDDKISFIDDLSIKAEIIEQNSSYIFYLSKGNSNIKISPISGTVKFLSIKIKKSFQIIMLKYISNQKDLRNTQNY